MVALATLLVLLTNCRRAEDRLEPRSLTWAELRAVRAAVFVTPPGEGERATFPRERLADGAKIRVDGSGLAWLRRDGGATLLVRGPARITLRARTLVIDEGSVFVDTPPGSSSDLATPSGKLALSAVRASLVVSAQGTAKAYVLSGEVRTENGARARAGEELALDRAATEKVTPVLGWDDWTGGLATTDRAAAPAPFGVGTVGARSPGDQGSPRFPLSIQRMDVRVTIDGDFALTEVDQSFFNPSSETVEGIYGFRAPERAILQRFGVDRDGVVVWGRVKEKAAAAAQYQAHVYQGSTEDPALLEWDAPGSYRARLYPIAAGETRRVVVRYAEWLDRTGEKGERRLYVYPMAADGSEESLPHVEELKVTFDLAKAGARDVRVGMAGVRSGESLVVRAHDFVPRADLALELLDGGSEQQRAYRAPHTVDLEALPPEQRAAAAEKAASEADYLLVPVRPNQAKLPSGGLDLVIVIDASAATEPATLSIARAATSALLSHLDDKDRALVLAGDDALRPVVAGWTRLAPVDAAARLKVKDALSEIARGGATDLGSMLTSAARELDPKRRSAIVYVGDAAPTVGELSLSALRERLDKLPSPVRIFGLGVGDEAKLEILAGITRGAFAERVADGYQAARAALRVLEHAERPVWLGTKVDLGPNVERLFPRDASALVSGETLWLVGRLGRGKEPEKLKMSGPGGKSEARLHLERLADEGDLARRWAEARLSQMLEDGEGRAALVDLGMKNSIITPVTSFYVPTRNEMSAGEVAELNRRREQATAGSRLRHAASDGETLGSRSEAVQAAAPPPASEESGRDSKEGGTGTRAKGEEGSLGALKKLAGQRFEVSDAPARRLGAPAELAPPAPAAAPVSPAPTAATASSPPPDDVPSRPSAVQAPRGGGEPSALSATGDGDKSKLDESLAAQKASGGLGLSGSGAGGGGLSSIGAIGDANQFGAGQGRTGGSHKVSGPKLRAGAATVDGRLPVEIVQRIVRQNFGRLRLCYEKGLQKNPSLAGRISARFVIGHDGSVSRVSHRDSDLADPAVVQCVQDTFTSLTFPPPEGGGVATVVFPILFQAGGAGAADPPAPSPDVNINIFIGDLPRRLLGCSAAASAPLVERAGLWRERLARAAGDVTAIASVYRAALGACEAPTYRERARLLSLMLDAIAGITGKVQLYRAMGKDLGASDVLYRGILARVRTSQEMRELHTALGLQTVDPAILAKLVNDMRDPSARAEKLSALVQQFPDDLRLSLELLNAYEDARDRTAVVDHARALRRRADADARVRTAVGELYLRLSQHTPEAEQKAALIAEGRRAFGEIVEFAPEDPVARRRLGDLLLSHRFFADAARQYETLSRLTPDDSKVLLMRAVAAEGQGLLEEALKWAENAGAAGAPDGTWGPAVTARALAATHLAWARLAAREAGRSDELEALSARARRILSSSRVDPDKPGGVRVSMTWSHPELHPSLWTNALGTAMPAPEGDVTLGVAQAVVPERTDGYFEVRLEPSDVAHAIRLGASIELTVVFDELDDKEKIIRKRLTFSPGAAATQRYTIAGKEVRGG